MMMNNPKTIQDDGLFEFLRTLVVAGIIAIVFRAFFFEPFSIPSGSMVPSLLVGDYLFVSKYSYGYSGLSVGLGFAEHNLGIKLPQGRFVQAKKPQRGDVIVFKVPYDGKTDYVKRLIGLPGDTIQVINGRLNINGEQVKRDVTGSYNITGDDLEEDHEAFRQPFNLPSIEYNETLPGGKQHHILEMSDEGRLDNTPAYTVPAGHYFVMGDNRDNSQDSRVMRRVGFVPEENLVGRAEFVFFSLKNGSPFWQVWKWPTHLRFDRIFMSIQ
jgi:signal peptidase I